MRVFSESGFRGATTRRIAEEAGVNEVTLFRQFKSKDALITEVAELYARRRSEEALPIDPVSPLQELSEWCDAHLELLRNSRGMIRKCMAEYDQHPHMAGCMRRGPDVVHRQLRDYATKLVAWRRLPATPDQVRVACLMLQGSLFADTMGRDIMPDMYLPVKRAGREYARSFLRLLGAHEDAGTAAGSGTTRPSRRVPASSARPSRRT